MCDECEAVKRHAKELEGLLEQVQEFLEGQVDVIDDPVTGEPNQPNEAMSLSASIDLALYGCPF